MLLAWRQGQHSKGQVRGSGVVPVLMLPAVCSIEGLLSWLGWGLGEPVVVVGVRVVVEVVSSLTA